VRIKSLNLACKSYRSGNPIDGFEYECEYYDKSGLCVECQDCICNFGDINPESGERINFILRAVQKRRGKKIREERNQNRHSVFRRIIQFGWNSKKSGDRMETISELKKRNNKLLQEIERLKKKLATASKNYDLYCMMEEENIELKEKLQRSIEPRELIEFLSDETRDKFREILNEKDNSNTCNGGCPF